MTERKSLWSHLPGILAGIAAIITAITGLYIAFGPGPREQPSEPPYAGISPPTTPSVVEPTDRASANDRAAVKTSGYILEIDRVLSYNTRCHIRDRFYLAKLSEGHRHVGFFEKEIFAGQSFEFNHEIIFDASATIVLSIEPCLPEEITILVFEMVITAEDYGKGLIRRSFGASPTNAAYALDYEVK